MSEHPSGLQELGRKSIEVLSVHVAKNQDGEITDRELMLISGALYDAVSGIIDWAEADVISQVYNHLAGVPETYKRKR